MYKAAQEKQQQEAGAAGEGAGQEAGQEGAADAKKDEDVVDADYKVDDDKDKK